MTIESRPMGGVRLTGADATAFLEWVKTGIPNPAARAACIRGVAIAREFNKHGKVFVCHPLRRRNLRSAMPEEIETMETPCPVCTKPVVSRWVKGGGMLHDNTITLAGDLLFHGDCWDPQIAEHPAG